MKNKILCFHLLNDYSGSPKVLSQVIKGFVKSGNEIDLFCAENGEEGFLSNLDKVNYKPFYYKWSSVKLLTLFRLFYSQLLLFALVKILESGRCILCEYRSSFWCFTGR